MLHDDDNAAERRARLHPTHADGERKKLHDFRNQLQELVLAASLQERELKDFLVDDLVETYASALEAKG